MTKENVKPKESPVDITRFQRKVSIRQYVDPEIFNMGLEKFGLSVFAGALSFGGQKEYLGCITRGRSKVYLTGLDINSPTILAIKDKDKREQKQLEISQAKEFIEKQVKANLDANNEDFWQGQYLDVKVPVLELDLTNVDDLIKYYNIKGGGYSQIAPSLSAAKKATSNHLYKFYLHEDEIAYAEDAQLKRTRNRAAMELEILFDEDPNKLFYVSKLLLPVYNGFRLRTPPAKVYAELDDFIKGVGKKTDIKKLPKQFIDTCNLSIEELKLKAMIKEALHQGKITKHSETGELYNKSTGTKYPKTEEQIYEFLMSPVNSDELTDINSQISEYWSLA